MELSLSRSLPGSESLSFVIFLFDLKDRFFARPALRPGRRAVRSANLRPLYGAFVVKEFARQRIFVLRHFFVRSQRPFLRPPRTSPWSTRGQIGQPKALLWSFRCQGVCQGANLCPSSFFCSISKTVSSPAPHFALVDARSDR